jgi:hypothetical protein
LGVDVGDIAAGQTTFRFEEVDKKEKNGVSAPHPPPGGMPTHDGNYGGRSSNSCRILHTLTILNDSHRSKLAV